MTNKIGKPLVRMTIGIREAQSISGIKKERNITYQTYIRRKKKFQKCRKHKKVNSLIKNLILTLCGARFLEQLNI